MRGLKGMFKKFYQVLYYGMICPGEIVEIVRSMPRVEIFINIFLTKAKYRTSKTRFWKEFSFNSVYRSPTYVM